MSSLLQALQRRGPISEPKAERQVVALLSAPLEKYDVVTGGSRFARSGQTHADWRVVVALWAALEKCDVVPGGLRFACCGKVAACCALGSSAVCPCWLICTSRVPPRFGGAGPPGAAALALPQHSTQRRGSGAAFRAGPPSVCSFCPAFSPTYQPTAALPLCQRTHSCACFAPHVVQCWVFRTTRLSWSCCSPA